MGRQEVGHDLAAVQGRNWQQIEPAQANIDDYASVKRSCREFQPCGRVASAVGKEILQRDKAGAKSDGQQKIGDWPGQGDEHCVMPWPAEIAGVNGHGLCPAEYKSACKACEAKNGEAKRINMGQGIEREPAHSFSCVIAAAPRHPAVGDFVQDDAQKRRDERYRNKIKRARKIKIWHVLYIAQGYGFVEDAAALRRARSRLTWQRAQSGLTRRLRVSKILNRLNGNKMAYNPASSRAEEFIDDTEVKDSIAQARETAKNPDAIRAILAKAKNAKGLDHRDAAALLACADPAIREEIRQLAEKIKLDYYGRRIVLFAPLYLSNYCVNSCLYCPYHLRNKHMPRKKLTQAEIAAEVIALQDMGHKRLAVEAGEDPQNNPIEYILESINTIYNVKHKNGAIRRVNVNIAATTVENYRKLHDAQIGTYILFQETYNKANYEKLHPRGPKHDYAWHTEAMDRAMQGGLDDVGLGALFGLDSYMYEFVAMLMHAGHLEAAFGVGPHTISVPRIKPADGIDPDAFDNGVDDDTFAHIIACLRVAVPYTGLIISTRESQRVRERALACGISQISGASRTSVGGYVEKEIRPEDSQQFEVSDQRSLDEVVDWLIAMGHVPSFCTACYREGRTGDRFMSLCKSGQIQNCCQPNALLTLKEYLQDYASEKTRAHGDKLIESELARVPSEHVRGLAGKRLAEIAAGGRDFRF